jgi:esterase/lipase superfamily enzyme
MQKLIFSIIFVMLAAIVYVGASYQATVYLMPTPAVISEGEFNLFDINPDREKSKDIQILFATNRIPAAIGDHRTYTIFPDDKLRMGTVNIQIGEKGTSWESILKLSTTDTDQRLPLKMKNIKEIAQYPLIKNKKWQPETMQYQDLLAQNKQEQNVSAQNTRALADMVNKALESSIDKDITIYVHGANTGVYRASAQAAQYHHFTGQNSVVMVYLWPSAENFLAYGTDTQHALRSAPAFAKLLVLLAQHTGAKNINILAYSAGAQIVSPALDIIGANTPEDKRNDYRLGEIYYAASDIGVDTFIKHLKNYYDMPRSITIAINRHDRMLAIAAWRNKISRLGRPDIDDLSEEKNQWLQDVSKLPELTIIKVSAETVSGMRTSSHDFWYSHPWVSSDILTMFLFHKGPEERGLVETVAENNIHYWKFTADYPERIIDIISSHSKFKINK